MKVKVNEAEMTLTKVSDGLSLSRMVLCQLCGIPLDAEIQLTDEHEETLPLSPVTATADVSTAWSRRSELKSLELATRIYDQKVNVTRADFLPSVAVLFLEKTLARNPFMLACRQAMRYDGSSSRAARDM